MHRVPVALMVCSWMCFHPLSKPAAPLSDVFPSHFEFPSPPPATKSSPQPTGAPLPPSTGRRRPGPPKGRDATAGGHRPEASGPAPACGGVYWDPRRPEGTEPPGSPCQGPRPPVPPCPRHVPATHRFRITGRHPSGPGPAQSGKTSDDFGLGRLNDPPTHVIPSPTGPPFPISRRRSPVTRPWPLPANCPSPPGQLIDRPPSHLPSPSERRQLGNRRSMSVPPTGLSCHLPRPSRRRRLLSRPRPPLLLSKLARQLAKASPHGLS
ncbi:uncharacterized protein N7529_002118 [Penicillium soppii]|uniref:uncharacterized protein n=1 Tax=Penicillium soppii TaxID=69789 RepID=UPI002547CBD2|nr:uncharacterized protein N7529_002118 [Penicillium soppii]KAJ5876534.1 hypothetical protein N7529_002118 [Penicillium soppii]